MDIKLKAMNTSKKRRYYNKLVDGLELQKRLIDISPTKLSPILLILASNMHFRLFKEFYRSFQYHHFRGNHIQYVIVFFS